LKVQEPLLKVRDPELWEFVDRVSLILNAGKYEFPITSSVPTQRANAGEQFVYANLQNTDRRFYVYIQGVWCRIDFNSDGTISAGTGIPDRILDSDQNTGIFTQFVSGEERLRHYSNGVYVVAIDTYGLQMAPAYKAVFDGLAGTTYWTYSSASSYMQFYENGNLRMEM